MVCAPTLVMMKSLWPSWMRLFEDDYVEIEFQWKMDQVHYEHIYLCAFFFLCYLMEHVQGVYTTKRRDPISLYLLLLGSKDNSFMKKGVHGKFKGHPCGTNIPGQYGCNGQDNFHTESGSRSTLRYSYWILKNLADKDIRFRGDTPDMV